MLTLKGHSKRVSSVAFSPNGKRLASGGWDNTVKLWNTADGTELLTLKKHSRQVQAVAFSPEGRRVASGGGGANMTVKIWYALNRIKPTTRSAPLKRR